MSTPEQQARETIDALLSAAGWAIQNIASLNLSAARGVAVREMQSHGGPADYILFVDGKALGVVEAKKEGTTLSAVAEESARYTVAKNWIPQRWADPLPFTYESTGIATNFRDQRDPDSRSSSVFAFHTPEHLLELVQQPHTLRARLRQFPELNTAPLRDCQIDAVTSLEKSLTANRPRALIQMATGSGKTFTAVTQAYRLIKHAGAKRILFLVDRGNLGRQTVNEFQQFTTPDDGRTFTDLYNVQMLGPGGIDPVCKVTVSTIQRLYSQLSGNATFDDEEKARQLVTSWKQFLEDNQDEITALQILYNRPHAKRHLVYEELKTLAEAVARPPYHIAPAEVWKAYEHLEKRPLTTDPVETLTNLITLVRHTVDPQKTPLAPFPELVETRYQQWLSQHGERFTAAQRHWLDVIKNYIALNGAFATDDQSAYLDAWQSVDSDEGVPFAVARKAFGGDPKDIIEELNSILVA